MSTSSTARSSSSSGHVRSTAEPHLYIPPIKEFPALPKKPVKPPAPRLSLVNEKKVLRRLKKKAITKTAKGSIAKVRRRYPGTASLRDTSSEGSVSSRGSSSGSTEGRSKKILAGSGLEKRKSNAGAILEDDKISLAGGRLEKGKSNEGAILANYEINLAGGRLEKGKSNERAILAGDKINLAGGRLKTGGYEEEAEPPAEFVQCRHDDVSSLGSEVRPTFLIHVVFLLVGNRSSLLLPLSMFSSRVMTKITSSRDYIGHSRHYVGFKT